MSRNEIATHSANIGAELLGRGAIKSGTFTPLNHLKPIYREKRSPKPSRNFPAMNDHLFSRTGVRYEVAIDVLGASIAHHSEAIGMERGKPMPDLAAIDHAQNEKKALRAVRKELDPTNRAVIESVIAQYGPIARRLYAQ